MLPLIAAPFLWMQVPALPVVEAKDLPPAPRGPLAPKIRDLGAGQGITARIRREARHTGAIPALQAPEGEVRIKDRIPDVSGWRAYAVTVPGGGAVKVHVVEGRKGWLRVFGVNAWGAEEEGLLQNRIPTGEPLATYRNPGKEPRVIYFVVDTLDADMVGEPFEVEITRWGM